MRAFLIAGEASGDRLGAALMDGLRARVPGIAFDGVGGPQMTARGLPSRFAMEELSVMGLAEVLPRYPALRRRMLQMAEAVTASRPDVLVTIDAPDFCLRVARRVTGIRKVHYVAPSVWAWRPGRAAKLAQTVDQCLALLPFEPPLLRAHGLRCDFVGHPVVAEPVATDAQLATFRAAHAQSGTPITVLPGSRSGEIARLAPIFGRALALLRDAVPDLVPLLPVAPGRDDQVRQATADWPVAPVLLPSDPLTRSAAFRASRVALAASGTVSLELAAAGTPMVIGYDMHPVTRAIMQRLIRTDTVTLVNLVSGTRTVPERIGRDCTPEGLARDLRATLADPAPQIAAVNETMDRLGRGGPPPGQRAADAILDGLNRDTSLHIDANIPG
ncbi:MAG: lipid-A-disaccharide synthase [Paracoccaceae bacterium]